MAGLRHTGLVATRATPRAIDAHRLHLKFIYSLRFAGLFIALLFAVGGMIMLFMGLEGSFDWAFSAPTEIEAKLTNASPGIVIATIGFILTWRIATLKPVNFETSDGGDDQDGSRAAIKIFADLPDPRYRNPERPERD